MAGQNLRELRVLVKQGPPYSDRFLRTLAQDDRAGAQTLYATCLRLQARADLEQARIHEMMQFEREAQDNGFARVAGVDEVGRGPLAGPIVAAAVVLGMAVPGLDDSKRLTAARRAELLCTLEGGPHAIGVCSIEPGEIDRLGIQGANYTAMARALAALSPPADFALVDGFTVPGLPCPQERIIKGDRRSQSIAAASIVAKVTRDRMMHELDRTHPGYGFAEHKGYGTAAHLDALARLGPCPIHRMSFAPMSGRTETVDMFSELEGQ